MDTKTWQAALDSLVGMNDDEFNELLRSALSERAQRDSGERLDWSSGFPVVSVVGTTVYEVQQ